MIKKQINAYTLLFISVLSIFLGIIILVNGFNVLKLTINLVGIFLIIIGIVNVILLFFKRKNEYKIFDIFIKAILNITVGLLIINFYKLIITSFTLLFGLYIFLIALINFISYFIYRYADIKGKLNLFLNFVVSFTFSAILFLNPSLNIKYVLIMLSIYLILYGIKYLINFIIMILPLNIKSRIEISIPIFIAMMLPKFLIREINELLKVEETYNFTYENKDKKPNLFVIIHLAKSGSAAFGHVEVAYNNVIYSYGNYNKHNRKLFDAIGDGIILIAEKDKYIDYCIKNKKRYLVEFGIYLTEKQEKDVEKRINDLININTEDFYSDLEKYQKGITNDGDFSDMSSEIYKYANGRYKKIIKGRNKVFFVMRNNCAYVAKQILKSSGQNIISINGIISPGTYYEYLNNAFLMKNTNVISRKIYVAKE